ncbi:FecR family protein [Horticoccus sp. 23ND18S-11]|uniref:FecR family protein n=1 Tax=Horticoccus sp. 23ND18S-11 TaxID=3391832 RepID=UPI0039C8E3BB
MKPSDQNAGREAADIEAEAMAWLAERDEGFAPGRAEAFASWRRRDARHAASVAELEQVLAQLAGLAARREELNTHFDRVSPPPPAPVPAPVPVGHWRRRVAWGGVAAALAVVGFFGFRAALLTAAPDTRYATAAAGYERARLGDGSTLELNSASAARVRFTAAERRVELESGEAHFEVTHDPARPFVVSAGGVTVRAVGTAFNVRFASGTVEIMVTEGKVTVAPVPSSRRSDAKADAASANVGSTLLNVRERLAIRLASASGEEAGTGTAVEHLDPADVRAAMAWQRRVTDFSDTPLAEVAARFNRHHAIQLVISDPVLGARRIGGIFALDDVEAFVRLLERDGIVRATREGDTVWLRVP